jgi:nicotinamidase-related amidase
LSSLHLEPKKTALILIDLQNGIVAMPTAPYSGPEVVEKSRSLAEAFRAKGAPVVYVRVDMGDFLHLPADDSHRAPNTPPPPAILSEIAPEAGFQKGDLLITKRHWGAFAGTKLEEELRQRGIETVVLGGIATNFGVESTARQGTGLGFAFVLVEDACTGLEAHAHTFAFETIFPRLSRVRKTDEVIASLA